MLGDNLERYRYMVKSPTRANFGPNSPITEVRQDTAKLIGKPFEQVCGLTRGWSKDQVFGLYREVMADGKNPAALWWVLWKEKRKLYGKTKKQITEKKANDRRLSQLGKESRRNKQIEGQGILF